MESVKSVVGALNGFGDGGSLFIALTMIGSLTMAIIQIIKDLSPALEAFQRRFLTSWIAAQAAKSGRTGVAPQDSQKMLVDLATGGNDQAFYELPTEKLVAQMNAAAHLALDYPQHYLPLLAVLSAGVADEDFKLVTNVGSARAAVSDGKLPPEYTDARTRLSHMVQRNLDGLQISMGSRWRLCLQGWAMVLSIGLTEVAIFIQADSTEMLKTAFAGLLLGIVGGYMAPVARDLVAAVQSLRK